MKSLLAVFALSLTAAHAADNGLKETQSDLTHSPRRAVPVKDVKVNDPFWTPKMSVYRNNTIPHGWNYLQNEIAENEMAAGWKEVKAEDTTPWNQANLHKDLEAVAYSLAQEPNPELDKKLDYIISALAAAQQPDGYCNALNTIRKREHWIHMDGQHEGYVAGHLIEAAVAHYLATGKTNFLKIARGVADNIYNDFIKTKREGVCGHAELELALARLYRVTGEQKYLDLAKDWIERRGKPVKYSSETTRSYFMDHKPIREIDEITGHAVRSVFFVTGVADIAVETGDKGLQDTARRLWKNTIQKKMYITGSVGSQESDEGFAPNYELPNKPGYNESCASCGMMYFAEAMFRLDGESESMDVLERSLYNAVLHGEALDGKTNYYRNPLTDENRLRDNCWVCCPPCLSRTLLRVPGYVYAVTDKDVYVNLYIGSTATLKAGDKAVTITQEGDYVRDGKMKVKVDPSQPGEFALRLRIPGWSKGAKFKLNGKDAETKSDKGYAIIDRKWQAGDTVDVEFPMPVQRIEARPEVKDNNGLVAIQRGPIVYGLEGHDNGGNVTPTLPTDPQFTTEYRTDLLGGVMTVKGKTQEGQTFTAIPFYVLANRGNSKQNVWLKQAGKADKPDGWNDLLYRPLP